MLLSFYLSGIFLIVSFEHFVAICFNTKAVRAAESQVRFGKRFNNYSPEGFEVTYCHFFRLSGANNTDFRISADHSRS